ncbi:MAG: diguanylate cyclase [Proteobacteria bacterium]|jgi:diguanylate cyclase (GGDEF)-like protein|nr:diguanylate cyclase [Desulfocapsa sp.]MBU3945970.1 diguanylate cyclase [Pseudomonadota bacterium]MCG2743708.1 diguanylate cyclase [Desulfobacteraceae bacterium]MBU4029942.1 diguanylate cyclase [Pseudomonadota bacterium]MBU4044229.1 diguanylate cyclase [Pseudomonadota bacterium]
MTSDNRSDIFQADYKVLDAAEKVLQGLEGSDNAIRPQFEEIYLGYKRLLRQSSHLIIIADRQQKRLIDLQNDIVEKNRELEALSITDGMTGIANRRRFDEVLTQEHAWHARSGAKLSLILLDVDHFKAFNDNYGHVQGDECLRQIARVIADCTSRPADLAARYGGEEFACILPETDNNGAIAIAEKIRCGIIALALPHKCSSVADVVTVSLGVVTVRCTTGASAVDIIIQVDELLYQAKSSGRNRVEFVKSCCGAGTSSGVV